MRSLLPALRRSDSASSHISGRPAGRGSEAPGDVELGPARTDSAFLRTPGHTSAPMAAQGPRNGHAVGAGRSVITLPAVREELRANGWPWLRAVLGTGVAMGCFAGLTYGINRLVQWRVAHARVDADPARWVDAAHGKYVAYYDGCGDCGDLDWAYNAYEYIRQVAVPGTVCDAAAMWYWPAVDRFPETCLQVLGATLQSDALAAAQRAQTNYYSLIIPATAIAVGVGFATAQLGRYVMGRRARSAATAQD